MANNDGKRRATTADVAPSRMAADAAKGILARSPAIDAALGRAREELSEGIREVGETTRHVRSEITALQGHVEELEMRLISLRQDLGHPAQAVENLKTAFVEQHKLEQARKLWGDSGKRAKNAYRLSWYVLAALLVGVPIVGIWLSDVIFDFFRKVGEAALVDLPQNASETAILIAAVSRLVLITLPVALYIWLIRIVVRFNMRSLLLMDDANQRNTMLETYLHLVEQDAGVKADRPLILEALFRRTPGHGPETIEPPNLADVLKLGGRTGIAQN